MNPTDAALASEDEAPPPAPEGLRAAARSRSFVAGPTGHPFHPILASVAVGAWAFSVVFDLGSFVADQAWAYARAAYVLTGFGVLVGIGAAILGLIDLLGIPEGTVARRHGVHHLLAMDATLVLFALSFVLRRGSDFAVHDAVDPLPFLLSVAGLATLAAGVWLGHRLAYAHGVRVNTDEARRAGFEAAEA